MAIQLNLPRSRRYKFYKSNLWGRVFLMNRFREKDVLYSRFNKGLTLKEKEVNPVKLRQKRLSLGGLSLFETLRLKRFYFNVREHQFRKIVSKAVRKPCDKRCLRTASDVLVSLLEPRLDAILLRSGLFSSPQMVRQLVSYKEIVVDNKVVNIPSCVIKVGQIVSFRNRNLKIKLLHRFLSLLKIYARGFSIGRKRKKIVKNKLRRFNKNRNRKDMRHSKNFSRSRFVSKNRIRNGNYFLFLPIVIANRLLHLTFSLKTLSLQLVDLPKTKEDVYYPFKVDFRKVLLHYSYIR